MNKFTDLRGTLFFPIKENNFNFIQSTVSINKKDVFRGIHINNFNKLVTCVKGRILDIIINMETGKANYYELDPNTNFFQVLVPSNYGHCFLSLEDDSILIYHFDGIFTNENTKHIHYLDPYIECKLPIKFPIMSDNDKIKNFIKPIDYIVFGHKGFLGGIIVNHLKKLNKNYIVSNLRLQNITLIEELLDLYSPKYVINCAGITGIPNIEWCDSHKEETVENNITYQLIMCKICMKRDIHLTILGSGAIFKNDKFYSELDTCNFIPNYYSKCRMILENLIKDYSKVLYLRINYPISSTDNPKNLLTKLKSYSSIKSVSLSISNMDSLTPLLFKMIENNEVGICNFVNKGEISLVNLTKQVYKDSKFEVDYILDNKKSFAKLIPTKLLKYGVEDIKESLKIL
jgi:3,5-epimerase/4-reductase